MFELKPKERRRSAAERIAEKQTTFDLPGIVLTGPPPRTQAMSFELTSKKRQDKPGSLKGTLFDRQEEIPFKRR